MNTAGSGAAPARRLALVTGASAGMGAAFARAYAARGLDVALVARRAERLQALASELTAAHGVEALVIPADLAEWEAHVPVIDRIEAAGRSVDVLVNNAGFGIPKSFTAVPWSRQRDFLMTMAVNACGLAYDVLPGMAARRWGRIINIASMAAFSPGVAGNSLYPGVKSLMIKFSQSLDAENRAAGVKVTAVCPGFVHTEFAAQAGIQEIMDREQRTFFADRRGGRPDGDPRQRARQGRGGAGLAQQGRRRDAARPARAAGAPHHRRRLGEVSSGLAADDADRVRLESGQG